MFSRKLSIQVEGQDARDVAYIARAKSAVLKVRNPDPDQLAALHNASPDTTIVCRIVEPEGDLTAQNGLAWADKVLHEAERCRRIALWWEGPNERADTMDEVARLNDFELAFAHKIQANGLHALSGNFGPGNPDITNNKIDQTGQWLGAWEKFYPAMQEAHGIGIHEYWNPHALADRWNAYRYQMFFKALAKSAPWALQKWWLVSELGVDGGLAGEGQKGWKSYMMPYAYAALLRQYDAEMQAYPTLTATIFTAGGSGWQDYDIRFDIMSYLANEQRNAPAVKWGIPAVLTSTPPTVTPPPVVTLPPIVPPRAGAAGWCPFATQRPLTTYNYWNGRTDNSGTAHAVKAVVMHIAAGPMRAVYPTFNAPGGVSAHFCIGTDGYLEQYVSIYDTAWHAGLGWENGKWLSPGPGRLVVNPTWQGLEPGINPNFTTIGIEHAGQPEDEWTPQMTAVNQRLLVWIAQQLGWSSYTAHANLIGHYEIDPLNRPNCPGPHVYYEAMAADANERLAIVAPPSLPTDAAHRWRSIVAVRNSARSLSRLSLNPDSALMKAALAQSMGMPLTDEFQVTVDGTTVVAQVFENGILFADIDKWDNIQKA